jgi:hypothetical protein
MTKAFMMAALLAAPFAAMTACSETVYHRETERGNLDGSRTRSQTTVRQNPDGTTTTDTDTLKVR